MSWITVCCNCGCERQSDGTAYQEEALAIESGWEFRKVPTALFSYIVNIYCPICRSLVPRGAIYFADEEGA